MSSRPITDSPSQVEDSDKDRVERDLQVVKNLAIITVEIRRRIEIGSCFSWVNSALEESGSLELAEKSLKGKEISHGTMQVPNKLLRGEFLSRANLDLAYLPIITVSESRISSRAKTFQEIMDQLPYSGLSTVQEVHTVLINHFLNIC